MKDANQPQTTNNHNDRDAAAQIQGRAERWELDYLLAGVKADILRTVTSGNCVCESVLTNTVAADLACIIKMLTSCVKSEREWAKKKVRELVRLGREAADETA